MTNVPVFCPGGSKSQTGVASSERYPGVLIQSCGGIPDPLQKLATENGPYIVPIWNSHEGEVKKADYVWNCLAENLIKITDAWAKKIEFWYVQRSAPSSRIYGLIGSVTVAKTQCSVFLSQRGSTLVECALTTVAFEKFCKGAKWDGVLIAPGQGELESRYKVVARKVANPNNFTSFVRFVPSRAFKKPSKSNVSWITGVQMPAFSSNIGEVEQDFFDRLLNTVNSMSELPKLIFVFNRDANVGLLFEGAKLHAGDLLDAEQLEAEEIFVYEEAGALSRRYTEELETLFENEFSSLADSDFILHEGVNTCLFACPPLNLYTNGYTVEAVRPVVIFYIGKLFQLWDKGSLQGCSVEQNNFFRRHHAAWKKKKSKFIKFKTIKPSGSKNKA